MHGPLISPWRWIALALLLPAAVGAQVAFEDVYPPRDTRPETLWVRSPGLMRRLSVGFAAVMADVYWIRAVQYYGDTKLSMTTNRNYDLLYPLLDTTTTLDPRFNIAYRFGAILLSEGYPNGPGEIDGAIALLQKGIRAMPEKWQYYHDAGFVEYWWRDHKAASEWFLKASKVPGAPPFLPTIAARALADGGDRATARALWQGLATAEHEWLRQSARRALMRLDAEDEIEALQRIVDAFHGDTGRYPAGWIELAQLGRVRRIPLDPSGVPYALDPVSGAVSVTPDSALYPLRPVRKP